MKLTGESKRSTDSLAALLLFCIFTFSILFVLLFGSRVFSGITARDKNAHADLNSSQFIYTELRSLTGDVSTGDFGGVPALFIRDEGIGACTAIYVYDGWLCELLYIDDGETVFAPQDGNRVLEASDAGFAVNDGLVDVNITTKDGKNVSFSCRVY